MELLSVAYAVGALLILGLLAEIGIRRLPDPGPLPHVIIKDTKK